MPNQGAWGHPLHPGTPPPAPGAGNAFHTAGGTHVDIGIYSGTEGGSVYNAWNDECTYTGFRLPWYMTETDVQNLHVPGTTDTGTCLGNTLDLSQNVNGNFFNPGTHKPKFLWTLGCDWPNDCPISTIPSGNGDSIFDRMVQQCFQVVGFPQVAIRIGWEVDGGWFSWSSSPTDYIAAFRYMAQYFKARFPFYGMPVPLIEWNAFSNQNMNPTGNINAVCTGNAAGNTTFQYYPGDDVVDIFGCDFYYYSGYPSATWCLTCPQFCIQAATNGFAAQSPGHASAGGKQVAFSEWGQWTAIGSSPATFDTGVFPRAVINMCDNCNASGGGSLAYQMYFDGSASNGYYNFTYYPNLLSILQTRYGQP